MIVEGIISFKALFLTKNSLTLLYIATNSEMNQYEVQKSP